MEPSTQKFIFLAIQEILHPTFEVTKQYLQVNEIEFENDKPKVERIELDDANNLATVYFPIKSQNYFLQISMAQLPQPIVDFVQMISGHSISLTATSYRLSYEELSRDLPLMPLHGWSKGDIKKNGKTHYEFSRISFNPFTSEAYELEHLISLMITQLEEQADAVRLLTEKANTCISICRYQYISANAGQHFSAEVIARLARLNLSVDIDTYIVGTAIVQGD
jgi:Domain of unknown function (DUF4279)